MWEVRKKWKNTLDQIIYPQIPKLNEGNIKFIHNIFIATLSNELKKTFKIKMGTKVHVKG